MSVLQDRITYADVTILACMHSSYFRVAGVCGNNESVLLFEVAYLVGAV